VNDGAVRVVTGYALVGELTVLADRRPDLYRQQMTTLAALTRGWILLLPEDRVAMEAARGGLIADNAAFVPREEGQRLYADAVAQLELAKAEGRGVVSTKLAYEKVETQARDDYRVEAAGTGVDREWARRFKREPQTVIDDWTVTIGFERAGITGGVLTRPKPHEVPTLRAHVAYHLGRLYFFGLEAEGPGGKADGNDHFDHFHFTDGVYADVLVTDDTRMHRIAELVGDVGVSLQRFEEWSADLLDVGTFAGQPAT
jgi:hypothetical protein